MRITGPGRTTAPQAGVSARRSESAGATFAPTGPEAQPKAAQTAGGAASLAGLDALIALQAVDADRPRGRKKAIRRGHDLLDVLDDIKVGLLSGQVSGSALDRIVALLDDFEASGDEKLDGLVSEIALRAEVELAKLGRYLPDRDR